MNGSDKIGAEDDRVCACEIVCASHAAYAIDGCSQAARSGIVEICD